MDDLPLLLYGSALGTGLVFGYVIQRGGFCLTRALSNTLLMRDATILRAYALALLVAMVGVEVLEVLSLVDIPLRPLHWLSNIVGGLLFGVGMILSGGCSGSTWYRVGEGAVGAWVVLLGFAIGATTAGVGVLSPLRALLQKPTLATADGGAPTLASLTGLPPWIVIAALALAGGRLAAARPAGARARQVAVARDRRRGRRDDRGGLVGLRDRRAAGRHHVRGEHRPPLHVSARRLPESRDLEHADGPGRSGGRLRGRVDHGSVRLEAPRPREPREDLRRRLPDGRRRPRSPKAATSTRASPTPPRSRSAVSSHSPRCAPAPAPRSGSCSSARLNRTLRSGGRRRGGRGEVGQRTRSCQAISEPATTPIGNF